LLALNISLSLFLSLKQQQQQQQQQESFYQTMMTMGAAAFGSVRLTSMCGMQLEKSHHRRDEKSRALN
jgi:hypothetical protein